MADMVTRTKRALACATLALGLTAGAVAEQPTPVHADLDCSYWDIINWQCGNTGFLGGRPPRVLVRAVPMPVRSWLGLWWGPMYGSWVRDRFAWER